MANLLELISISKYYEKQLILSEISLTLEAGTAVAVTGNSGGGKTTLLSIIGLLQSASSGQILVDDVNVTVFNQQQQAAIRGRSFGFVFQRARLINSLTVLENVILPAVFSRPKQEASKRAKALLTDFGLTERLDYKPQQLSLGQLRRVSLARALLLKPPILLADEPTNDLDPALARTVVDALFQARNEGAGVIIVTHDPALARQADIAFRLESGRLIRQ